MTAIAPVLFHAFPEDAPHDASEPYRECFNAGAPADAIDALSTPFKASVAIWAAVAFIAAGLAPAAVTIMLFVVHVFTHHPDPFGAVTEWMEPFGLPSVALFIAGIAWAQSLTTSLNPKAKAWKKALGDAWAAHGGEITVLRTLDFQTRDVVRDYAGTLEKVRQSLNRLDPEGDELDVARYTLQRYIEASNIPPLGAKAAKATHITDPKVRKAAKEYEAMVKQQEYARGAVEVAVAAAEDLLATRTQARSDADLIKRVNER